MERLNRTQWLLLGFIAFAVAALIVIGQFAPEVYDEQLRPLGLSGAWPRVALIAALFVFLGVLVMAMVRRSRWAIWLMLLATRSGATQPWHAPPMVTRLGPARGP